MPNPGDSNDLILADGQDIFVGSGKIYSVNGEFRSNGVPVNLANAIPPMNSGEYASLAIGNVATVAMTQDFAYYIPFDIYNTVVLQSLLAEVTTLAASSLIRLGIYSDDGSFRNPGAKFFDAGSQASDTTGVKTFAAAVSLPPARYWMVAVAQGGAPTVRAAFTHPIRHSLPTATSLANFVKGVTGVSGALPANATAATNAAGAEPVVYLRAA